MTGSGAARVYLDWNAAAPLRPEARDAMTAAMKASGNPSSVHTEGREARAIVEKARGQVAELVGCAPDQITFTSGATEAAGVLSRLPASVDILVDATAHACLWAHSRVGTEGHSAPKRILAHGWACGETGVVAPPRHDGEGWIHGGGGRAGTLLIDIAQLVGRRPVRFPETGADFAIVSAQKLGGPKGVGALITAPGQDPVPLAPGGGQELGRRSGTENVIGIAGFGAAAAAAQRDLEQGVWERVEKLRDSLENALAQAAPDAIFIGRTGDRLPNTCCIAVPGWEGAAQAIQMDLSRIAVSAGSACASGKVEEASRVLMAMGFDRTTASSAIRVSMGPTTTEDEVAAFAEAWSSQYRRRRTRAA